VLVLISRLCLYNEISDRVSGASVFIGAGFAPERGSIALGYIKLVIGNTLQFASTANDRTGWPQIAASLESHVRDLVAQSRSV
jgi:hypothetical protein